MLPPPLLLPLLIVAAVGVAGARHVDAGHHGDAAADDRATPIKLPEARRICATLCMSGLGGAPCGSSCPAVQPFDFPVQSVNGSGDGGAHVVVGPSTTIGTTPFPRRDACPLLCKYQLGQPLCDCPPQMAIFDSIFFTIDFDRICGFFCARHAYRIYGCPECDTYVDDPGTAYAIGMRPQTDIDWDGWCREKCAVGDGGVACNCDILPLSLPFDDKERPNED